MSTFKQVSAILGAITLATAPLGMVAIPATAAEQHIILYVVPIPEDDHDETPAEQALRAIEALRAAPKAPPKAPRAPLQDRPALW